jgi:TatD DNase family protein
MTYIDFHTHHIPVEEDVLAVVDGRDTWGIHPWRAMEELVVPDFTGKLAIGECGLDGLKGPSLARQEEVFLQQISLSEQLGKPLIIHCVKAIDRLLSLRKELRPKQPWMLHGFRGKPRQLQSLLDVGFFVGFGFLHNEESLRACPTDRLLLETDDNTEHPIAQLYKDVAQSKGLDVPTLVEMMHENYLAFFRNAPLENGEKVKN